MDRSITSENYFNISGADVSSLQQALDLGAKYYDEDGNLEHPVKILKDNGVNYIRLRAWVNPANGYNNTNKVVEFARLIKSMGLKLLLNLHYSDRWTDPSHQAKPAEWADHPFNQLQTDVYDYTYDFCTKLQSSGAVPEMVQLGNEINFGMLLPDGSIENWDKLASLLKQGYNAVKACSPSIEVMLHIADACDNQGARKWFDNAQSQGVKWDLIGLSYYSFFHGTIKDMENTIKDLVARYDKPVIIVETAYPFTLAENDNEQNVVHFLDQLPSEYPPTPKGQQKNLRDVINTARSAGAKGIFYWEPTWTAVKGGGWDPDDPSSGCSWENQALFDFNSRALPSLKELML